MRELRDQKAAINALLADGHKFAHPLKHLGRTADDLPVLAIDSFQHMFLFPNMSELQIPGKLRQVLYCYIYCYLFQTIRNFKYARADDNFSLSRISILESCIKIFMQITIKKWRKLISFWTKKTNMKNTVRRLRLLQKNFHNQLHPHQFSKI